MGGFILISKPEDLILWKQRIKERTNSGMSVSQWCKINEISKNKYHYWNNKISKKQQTDNETEFAEVTSIISDTHKSVSSECKVDNFQILFKNVQVTVPSNFNKDSLSELLRVLQQI